MKKTLEQGEIINSKYEIKFFLSSKHCLENYSVRGNDGKVYFLELYNSSKLSRSDFSGHNLLEVDILKSLDIEGLVSLVDDGEYIKNGQKYHYIILDFVSGETLQDKLSREGPFSQYAAVPIVLYLLESIQKIHNKTNAIIHNNIDLDSIYLEYSDDKEMPILTQFGFARYMTSKSNSINLSCLNPFYIAPEMYNGISIPQSDIFSVGALLYNLIIGIPPWHVELPKYKYSDDQLTEAIIAKRQEPLFLGANGKEDFQDEYLQEVIKKALTLNIDERFKNIDEFMSALKRETVLVNNSEEKKPAVHKRKGPGFSAIAGMQSMKDLLYNDVIRALNEVELYESYGITIPNGMLLYGPPGCGKTFISERFSEEVGFNFLQLKPSDIKSKYINATEEKISAIFDEAAKNAPTIIFIDEIDAVVPSREGDLHQMQASPVNEFLAQMSNCSEKGIFVIAASNRPEKIDPAILRTGRIDRIIYLPPPDYEARVSMFKLYLKKRPIDLGLDYTKLAEMTDNYVSSDIKFLVDEASRYALNLKTRITQEIFNKIILDTKPSVSLNELNKYELLRERFENRSDSGSNRVIGFR